MNKPQPILAVVISMLAIFVYYTWINPPVMPKTPPQTQQNNQQTPQTPVEVPQNKSENVSTPITTLSTTLGGLPLPTENLAASRSTFKKENVEAKINHESGNVDSWVLKDYHTEPRDDAPFIDFFLKFGR